MGKVIPLWEQGDYGKVIREIRYLWEEERVSWSDHVKEQMEARKFDMLDVQNAIRYGDILSHRIEKNRYKYLIKGTAVDGRSLRCAVIVLGSLILITVMP